MERRPTTPPLQILRATALIHFITQQNPPIIYLRPLHFHHFHFSLHFICAHHCTDCQNMSIFSNSGKLTFSFKVGLLSTCVLSVAVLLKFSAPLISDFVASDVPVFWNLLLQWLKPPYLYLVVNCIIISIVASCKLQQNNVAAPENAVLSAEVQTTVYDPHVVVYDDVIDLAPEKVELSGDDVRNSSEQEEEEKKKKENAGGDVVTAAAAAPMRSDSMEFLEQWFEKEKAKEREKPLVSARFGQRKAVKSSPEGGKALRVSKQKRSDTLESTWKTITEGRAMPLTRHLKKSDTWDTHVRHNTPPPPLMKKSETFHERTTTTDTNNSNSGSLRREPSLRLRKEPSPSQDELNRRVEAFIKKFNEEMRLQRQRSLDQYNEMINRRAN